MMPNLYTNEFKVHMIKYTTFTVLMPVATAARALEEFYAVRRF